MAENTLTPEEAVAPASNPEELLAFGRELQQQTQRSTAESTQDAVIPAETINQPQQELTDLPQTFSPSASQSSLNYFETLVGQQRQAQQRRTAEREGQQTALKRRIDEQRERTLGRGERTQQLREERDLPFLEDETEAALEDLERATLSSRRRQEAIRTEAGLTEAQVGARQREVARKDAAYVADLSLKYNALSRSTTRIQEAIDERVKIEFEDEEQELSYLQKDYEVLQGLLTAEEDRQAQALIARENSLFELKTQEYSSFLTAKAEAYNNAVLSGRQDLIPQIQAAQDMASLSQVAPADPIQLAELQQLRANTAKIYSAINGATPTDIISPDVPTFEEFVEMKESEAGQTIADREALRAEYEAQTKTQALEDRESRINSLSPVARNVFLQPELFFALTPTERGGIITEVSNAGLDATTLADGKKNKISSTQADDLAQARLALRNVRRIQELFEEIGTTGPGVGQFRNANPFDGRVVELNQLITQTVPGLARGIFKEVGVLTDVDVERYTNTLANTKLTTGQAQTANQNLIDLIEDSVEIQVDTLDSLGYDLNEFSTERVLGTGDGLAEDDLGEIDSAFEYFDPYSFYGPSPDDFD